MVSIIPQSHIRQRSPSRGWSYPTILALIPSIFSLVSSMAVAIPAVPHSDLLDLTGALGPRVAAFNKRNINSPIKLLAKAEFRNPGSQSHKDRIVANIIARAAERGELMDEDGNKKTIIAASSGNTGHALAVLGTKMGYDVVIITNKKCSKEKCDNIVKAGATLWLSEDLTSQFPDVLKGVNCYMDQEDALVQHYPNKYFSVNQYGNLDNMMAHYQATASEIWDQSQSKVTHFVMAASTGGSIMGVGKFLKEKDSNIRIVLSDPHKSHLAGILEKARGNVQKATSIFEKVEQDLKTEGGIQVEGAGKEELTDIMKMNGEVLQYVDEAIIVHDFDAFDACRELEKERGIRVGGSAGLNICACRRLAEQAVDEGRGNVVLSTLLCDDGNKYASKIFNDEWMEANDPRPKQIPVMRGGSSSDTETGYHLDPEDWVEYRAQMHKLLDSCCDRMESYREKTWLPPPEDLAEKVQLDSGADTALGGDGEPLSEVMDSLVKDIMPYATGNTNPRFFGWVHGAGLPSSIAADLVAATMNSNCGGRNQGAADVEVACINFLTRIAGFTSAEPFGVLTGGTSQATIYALMAARTRKFGYEVRKTGILGLGPVRVYVSDDAHSCVTRAMECLGHGAESVVRIPCDKSDGSMNVEVLRHQLKQDIDLGITPLAIVGTAGSVTVGGYDDFGAIADLAAELNIWFHVDAAFGFWTRLSQDSKIRAFTENIGQADSIALDAHKWPGVNYDCGALLVKDKKHLRSTLASRPAYLKSTEEGLAGGDTWFTDYSLDLSRGFRALKLWTALKSAGTNKIGQVITDNCMLATYMAKLVNESPLLEMAHTPLSNIACFSIKPEGITATEVASELQLQGKGVFSTINLDGMDCLRAALVNHRTTEADIALVVASVEEAVTKRMRKTELKSVSNIDATIFQSNSTQVPSLVN